MEEDGLRIAREHYEAHKKAYHSMGEADKLSRNEREELILDSLSYASHLADGLDYDELAIDIARVYQQAGETIHIG